MVIIVKSNIKIYVHIDLITSASNRLNFVTFYNPFSFLNTQLYIPVTVAMYDFCIRGLKEKPCTGEDSSHQITIGTHPRPHQIYLVLPVIMTSTTF